jgi:hypothetical protein
MTDMTPSERAAWEAGRDAAADLAWSDQEDRPWENWGEDRNVKTAQIVAKEIAAAIRSLTPPTAFHPLPDAPAPSGTGDGG